MTEYNICPIAKPRMSQKDKFMMRPATKRYWNFVNECKMAKVIFPCFGASVTFVLPMPDSWSKKKKSQYDGKPHMVKPDLDNLLKALGDAIYKNDSGIYHLAGLQKKWGFEGKIIIENSNPIPNQS